MADKVKETPAMRLIELELRVFNGEQLNKKESEELSDLYEAYRGYLISVEVINQVVDMYYSDAVTARDLIVGLYSAAELLANSTNEEDLDKLFSDIKEVEDE